MYKNIWRHLTLVVEIVVTATGIFGGVVTGGHGPLWEENTSADDRKSEK
jgi:hypothetical protein